MTVGTPPSRIALALGLAACAENPGIKSDEDGATVRLASSITGSSFLAVTAGLDQGIFAKHRVKVEVVKIKSTAEATAALASGDADLAAALTEGVIAANAGGAKLKIEPLHLGGRLTLDGASIKCVPAVHDSPLGIGENWRVELGAPCGFVVDIDGTTIYHAGDTALFGDMALFAPVDVALLPIDGRMVMEPVDAVRAAQILQARTVIPMHWRDQDPHAFVDRLADARIAGHVMKNGEERAV
ncbi:MBL fold metallo-hydrolase [Streptomyces sp. NPDC004629]|uniref:MBL fold metallo-hydrolase n=1 Tax=Streptomyces sp. NPDC004629 TaxID=3364705 RepID=UPI0036C89FDD